MVDAVNESKVSPLMYAAASDHIEVMKLLIAKGADLEFKHTNGGTALMEASTGGAVKALKLLIDSGAKYNFVDDDGVSPLMAAASQGHFETQTLLVDQLKAALSPEDLLEAINAFSDSGGSAVMFSAAGGHWNCTKQLMDLGADVKAIARAKPGYPEKLAKMVEEGIVQEQEPHVDGVTALHVAAQGGHLDVVKLLLEAGVDVSVEDDEKRTPLKMAIQGNYGEVASALVAAGADPNTEFIDEDGTAHNLLMDAIIVENVEFAKLLIEKGADIYYSDDRDVSTLLQASHRGMTEVVELLLSKHDPEKKPSYLEQPSDDGVSPLIAAASEGHVEIVKALLKAGADVNSKDKDATTALMAASARGHKDVVEALLEAKPDVNLQNEDGHTALMFAYNGKNQVDTLWERYAQYVTTEEGEDDGGTGPLLREAVKSHAALVDLLLKHGANPKLKDKEGHVAKDFDYNPDADAELLSKAEKVAAGAKKDKKDEL
jgi:ankyrin repeat protein